MDAMMSMSPGGVGMSDRDTSADLLRTIAEVLDIRSVFPRVSEIVRHVLPHDALELMFHDRSGQVTLEARSNEDLTGAFGCSVNDDEAFYILNDLRRPSSRLTSGAPSSVVDTLLAAGYRSVLNVRSVARDQVMRLGFLSKQADAYRPDDVKTAQHIADYVAVAVAHEQLAAAERDRAEARGSAERVARGRAVADKGEALPARGRMIGRSEAWQRVLARALRVASTDTTVFLQGESGTGKEVVARFIHEASQRKDGPLVAINCAALPEQLLESELFGYERGAFTGAQQAKAGQIEQASTGVLFLDEVSEMSPMAQAKLLRVLQEREFRRLGGTRSVKANVRVIAATNRDLHQAVSDGSFREDLCYRLQVFDIRIPPLRERRGDIPLLTDAFLQDFYRSTGCASAGLTPDALEMLVGHESPGNVRELHNALERAAILCEGGLITVDQLSLRSTSVMAPSRPPNLSDVERRTIEQALHESDGNKAKAARTLGITRTQLYCRLRKYGLATAEARNAD